MLLKNRVFVLAIAVSLLILGLFFYLSEKNLRGDSTHYYFISDYLASGKGFLFPGDVHRSVYDFANPKPTMYREPLYIVLWAGLIRLTGDKAHLASGQEVFPYTISTYMLIILQVICFFIAAIFIYRIGLFIFNEKIAALSAMLMLFFPAPANYAILPVSETIFMFLLIIAAYILIKGVKTDDSSSFILAGLFLGLATLCKAVIFFYPFFFTIVYLSANIIKSRMKLIYVRNICLLLVSFYLILIPWMYRNYIVFNRFSLTVRQGTVLGIRADRLTYTASELKMWTVTCFSEYIANRMFKGYDLRVDGDNYFNRRLMSYYHNVLLTLNNNYEEVDELLMERAKNLIVQHPVKYIFLSGLEFIRLNSFPVPLLNSYKNIYAAAAKGLFKIAGWLITLFAFLGIFKSFRLWDKGLSVIISIIIYFNLVYISVDCTGRYIVPVIPFYLLAMVVFFNKQFFLLSKKK